MEKRLHNRWIIAFLLVIVLACTAGLAVIYARNAMAGDVDVPSEKLVYATVYLGRGGDDTVEDVYYYENFQEGWPEVIRLARQASVFDQYIQVILKKDWAPYSGINFGEDSAYYSDGSIYIPAGLSIKLDLAGYTIDRKLTEGVENGHVLHVAGNLTVSDSSSKQTGTITGGFNTTTEEAFGGGVYVNGGNFTLNGGSIVDNQATGKKVYGIGVVVVNGGTFTMNGGTISGHSNTSVETYGAGVCVFQNGVFTLNDGVIEKNTAVYGGGVACYGAVNNTTAVNIDGGIITGNKAFIGSSGSSSTRCGGGAICLYNMGSVNISDGEIRNNITDNYGGGIFVYVNSRATANLSISGGEIHHNAAINTSSIVYGGGVALYKGSSSTYIINANVSGGIIDNNLSVGSAKTTFGGGIYNHGATLSLSDGTISNNRTGFLQDTEQLPLASAIEKVYEGDFDSIKLDERKSSSIYSRGGGVYVDDGTFAMSGGTVNNNTAYHGAGVYADAQFAISGGSVVNNHGTSGAGVYLGTTKATIVLSGCPQIADNFSTNDTDGDTPSNLHISKAGGLTIDGALDDDARIHLSVDGSLLTSGQAFTSGYGAYNSATVTVGDNTQKVYADPYRYFVPDITYLDVNGGVHNQTSEQHIVILAGSGELAVVSKPITFVVTYKNLNTQSFTFGDEDNRTIDWNYIADSTYGDSNYPVSIIARDDDGKQVGKIEFNATGCQAGIYTLQAAPDDAAQTEFSVVVKAKELSNDNVNINFTFSGGSPVYDGNEHEPTTVAVALKTAVYGTTTLAQGTDYEYVVTNKVNAGTALVTITFKGNYAGTATKTFTIATNTSGAKMSVEWEYHNGTTWVSLTSANKNSVFTYNGSDQCESIRAKLTAESATQYVTVGVEGDDLYLQIRVGTTDAEFKNAGTYTISIIGNANYEIADTTQLTLVMNKMRLELSAEDFENEDALGQRLWHLKLGDETFTDLRDRDIKFIDPSVTPNANGISIAEGDKDDYYARFRGTALELVLNNNYTLGYNNMTIADILAMAQVKYANNTATGESGTVTTLTSSITITFDNNYDLPNVNSNTINLNKSWAIVTVTNDLRMDDGTTISSKTLGGWTFGNVEELNGYAFRPEHGDTVIYTYTKQNSSKVLNQFALVYTNSTINSAKVIYGVKEENGALVADRANRISTNGSNYLYTYNNSLKAGAYTLTITIPQNDPSTDGATNWFDDATNENVGTMCDAFSYTFSFSIGTYAINSGSGPNVGISYTFPDNVVAYYNGSANNFVHPVIKLYDKVLVEGEDYELISSDIEVGFASLTVKGIRSLTGEFTITDAYEIRQGTNTWYEVPSIMYWTYKGFDRSINLIVASTVIPLDDAGGLWFAIARDSAGTDLYPGLEHIVLDSTKLVSADVATILDNLDVGEYYLCAHVDETDNYTGINAVPILFRVFAATNSWTVTPSVETWTEGQYTVAENHILASATFGTPHVVIMDDEGNEYYNSAIGLDLLSTAKAGTYTLTAKVEGSANYSGLPDYMIRFQVFEKPGLPWWATVLIAIGSLAVAAAIILIMWKEGVFQIVTEKIVVAIRTRASVEATIASVRAAKMMEEGRKSVEEAKRRERMEQLAKEEQSKAGATEETHASEAGEVETPATDAQVADTAALSTDEPNTGETDESATATPDDKTEE